MYTWVYTGEVTTRRVREKYLKAILRQNIAFFDRLGPGEVTTRIETDTHLIQEGISEKVAISVFFVAIFISGFVIAVSLPRDPPHEGAWLTPDPFPTDHSQLAPRACLLDDHPVYRHRRRCHELVRLEVQAAAARSDGRRGDSGGRGHRFGPERPRLRQSGPPRRHVRRSEPADVSNSHVSRWVCRVLIGSLVSLKIGEKSAHFNGLGLGVFFFIIYGAYGLAFYYGTTLLLQNRITSGEVVNVFFSILIGAFSLAQLAPNLQAISFARGAATEIYATIDRKPIIDSESEVGLKPESVTGRIELEHIDFIYPSR